MKTLVSRFSLQPIRSFPDGAPQRESYDDDETFARECLAYQDEWRTAYICGHPYCTNRDCPSHFPS